MRPPLAILGLDVGEMVEDAIRALIDLVVPDLGAEWVSQLVTWLVALPPVTGDAFPALNRYAAQLTAVGFGLLGACFVGGLLQLWAGGFTGMRGTGEAVKRAAIAAGALVSYPTVLEAVLTATNVLTAQMIKHPLVEDGLDKAFGGALIVAAVTGGLSLGLAVGAAVVVLYFLAALVVMKIGLTTALSVAHVAGALVWGLYPLPQAAWLARAWTGALVAALVVPIGWACVFAAAALLAADTLVFDGGGRYNQPLGEALQYLVKPLAAVACFWLAYRTPGFLLGLARSAGMGGVVTAGAPFAAGPPREADESAAAGRMEPASLGRRAVQTNADRFRALTHQARARLSGPQETGTDARVVSSSVAPDAASGPAAPARAGGVRGAVRSGFGPLVRANRWWRRLPDEGHQLRSDPRQADQVAGRSEAAAASPVQRSDVGRAGAGGGLGAPGAKGATTSGSNVGRAVRPGGSSSAGRTGAQRVGQRPVASTGQASLRSSAAASQSSRSHPTAQAPGPSSLLASRQADQPQGSPTMSRPRPTPPARRSATSVPRPPTGAPSSTATGRRPPLAAPSPPAAGTSARPPAPPAATPPPGPAGTPNSTSQGGHARDRPQTTGRRPPRPPASSDASTSPRAPSARPPADDVQRRPRT